MTHVVIAEDEAPVRQLFLAAFEQEGYHVTAPDDFWGVLAVLRSVLHPVIVIYDRHNAFLQLQADDEQIAALEANRADLQRHRYFAVGWKPRPLRPPRLAALEAALQVEVVPYPLNLQALLAAVERAASKLQA
jgi:CheY-like chemotaxis protein